MKIWIETLGCKVNTYESEVIKSIFLKNNYEMAFGPENADVFVVIGTSFSVSSAKVFPSFPRPDVPRYIIDPIDYRDSIPEGYIWIKAKATEGMKILTDEFLNGFPMFEKLFE